MGAVEGLLIDLIFFLFFLLLTSNAFAYTMLLPTQINKYFLFFVLFSPIFGSYGCTRIGKNKLIREGNPYRTWVPLTYNNRLKSLSPQDGNTVILAFRVNYIIICINLSSYNVTSLKRDITRMIYTFHISCCPSGSHCVQIPIVPP